VPEVDDELPRVTASLLRRADEMCRRRLAREHAGAKRHVNKTGDARFEVSNRIVADARLAQAELGPPRPEAFVDPAELEPEQRALYRAAARGYVALFGTVPGRAADLGWCTTFGEHGVDLVGDAGLAVEHADGTRELRLLKFGADRSLLERTDVHIALLRTETWAPTQLRVVAADLLTLERAEHEADVVAERRDAHEWFAARTTIVKQHARDGRPRPGADCNGCAFVAGCSAHG
jgi:hypothetical protein